MSAIRNPSQPRPQGRQIDLLVLVGPSGAGKSTLINELRKDFPASFGYSISHTTRAPRPGEINGVHYHFIDMPTFQQRVADNGFMEHAIVHGTCYGTSFQSLKDVLDLDQIVCMDLDIVGGHNVRQLASLGYRSLVVWVCPPTFEVLEQRLRKRNSDPEEKIKTRLQSAISEWKWKDENASFFDGIFVNDDLERCYAEFRHFIMSTCFASSASGVRKHQNDAPEEVVSSAAAVALTAEPASDASSTSPARSEGEPAVDGHLFASGNSPIQTFATATNSSVETSPDAQRSAAGMTA